MTAFTLAHFSDPHLPYEPRLDWRQRFSKRILSAWSWHRSRRAVQRPDILAALADDVRAQQPDHIAVTGDITNFSLPGEFEQAAAWLRTLGDGARVSVVPGNHDALVPVAPAEGWDHWQPWMRSDDADATQWPYLRLRGDVALIGVSSALPTPPTIAGGRVGAAQLAALEALLDAQRGRFRVVLVHHPLADGAVSRRKALRDRAELRAVLQRAGCELVLTGHARDARLDLLDGATAPIVCLGLPSSTAAPNAHDQGARWHALRIEKQSSDWRLSVAVRLWDEATGAFCSGGTYDYRLPRTGAIAV
ncbi:metallophosphoesterase family protein [Solimonas marina]|uniref:Metallophosphoesterase n=1 Tax=Solimonas marina TaxID=2714601 RepID=A0A969W9N0_9GAMM|nr:metallophosphoesterase [Solimonas marina]NKF23306.1 metallophosphoesterase [Solimonas marina]